GDRGGGLLRVRRGGLLRVRRGGLLGVGGGGLLGVRRGGLLGVRGARLLGVRRRRLGRRGLPGRVTAPFVGRGRLGARRRRSGVLLAHESSSQTSAAPTRENEHPIRPPRAGGARYRSSGSRADAPSASPDGGPRTEGVRA